MIKRGKIFYKTRLFASCNKGATAIEMAFVALPLILSILGTIEAGRIFWTRTAVSDVAQMGARCFGIPEQACKTGDTRNIDDTENYILEVAQSRAVSITELNIIIDASDCGEIDKFVRIEISSEIDTVIGKTFTLTGNACHIRQSDE